MNLINHTQRVSNKIRTRKFSALNLSLRESLWWNIWESSSSTDLHLTVTSCVCVCVCVCVFSHVQLRDPMNYGPPGTPVHGISQPRILEWVAIFFSRGSSCLYKDSNCLLFSFFSLQNFLSEKWLLRSSERVTWNFLKRQAWDNSFFFHTYACYSTRILSLKAEFMSVYLPV